MNLKRLTPFIFASLILSGCNNQTPTASCSSPDTQKLINTLLTEQAEKLTVEKRYDQYDGSFVFGATKIRASLAQIQIILENVNTVNQDVNSSKSTCNGLLNVTVPPAILNDANIARDSQQQPKIAQYAKQLNIESNSNVFTQMINYSVKPAGKNKEPLVEFETSAWVHLLDEITTSALLKPTVDSQETFYIEKDEQPEQHEPVQSEADANLDNDKIKALQVKHNLEKLNQEILEAEQIEKEQGTAQATEKPVYLIPTNYPSFNCATVTKPTEITICNNPALATLDVENMKIYKIAKNTDPVITKEIWMNSIKSKYACGTDIDCITNIYKKSIRNYGCVADKALYCTD